MIGFDFQHEDFLICLNKMRTNIQSRLTEMLEPYDLSSMHSVYIMTLNQAGEATLADLSKWLHCNRANTTRVVRDLMQKGYVGSNKVEENQRKFKVFLTEKGKQLAIEFHIKMDEGRVEEKSRLTPEEWETLYALMHKLTD